MTGVFRMAAGLALLAGMLCTAPRAEAAALTGDTITGTLTFCKLGASGNNFTPVSIVAPDTFSWTDGANVDSAVFSD
ncbi:MAG TPA: hypothetical protein VLI90_20625, partial [Tepidisphaeraceae bacterium]|nr:hypothetical protein [Tepidisphaeraceae bacterium]